MSDVKNVKTSNVLIHHGIKGQRWGVRRYQNEDGSLTEAGKKKLSKYQNEDSSLTGKGKENESKGKKVAKVLAISSAAAVATVAAGVTVHKGTQWVSQELGKAMYNAAWNQIISDANRIDSFVR